jgi:hypothetical protein
VRDDNANVYRRVPRQVVAPVDPRGNRSRIGRALAAALEQVGESRKSTGPAQNMVDAGDDESASSSRDHLSLDDVGEVDVALKDPEIQRGGISVADRRVAQHYAKPATAIESPVLLADRSKEGGVVGSEPHGALGGLGPRPPELVEIDGVAADVRVDDRLKPLVAELDHDVVHNVSKRGVGHEIPQEPVLLRPLMNLPKENDAITLRRCNDSLDGRPKANLVTAAAQAPHQRGDDRARRNRSDRLPGETRYVGAQSYAKTGSATVLRRRAWLPSGLTAHRLIGPVSA